MSLKRIPTPTQDAGNWGTILNDHLAQTSSPLNGAFNSFDQFSARPTNLTADDAGRTYLYTQTGNWHEWSGTEWKVQNKSEINVKDYGAIGDGVADDTAAINFLMLTFGKIKTFHFPEGNYVFKSDLVIENSVSWVEGTKLIPQNDKVIRIEGHTNGVNSYVFDNTNGKVIIRRGPIYPEWWGAEGSAKIDSFSGSAGSNTVTVSLRLFGSQPVQTLNIKKGLDVCMPCQGETKSTQVTGIVGVPTIGGIGNFNYKICPFYYELGMSNPSGNINVSSSPDLANNPVTIKWNATTDPSVSGYVIFRNDIAIGYTFSKNETTFVDNGTNVTGPFAALTAWSQPGNGVLPYSSLQPQAIPNNFRATVTDVLDNGKIVLNNPLLYTASALPIFIDSTKGIKGAIDNISYLSKGNLPYTARAVPVNTPLVKFSNGSYWTDKIVCTGICSIEGVSNIYSPSTSINCLQVNTNCLEFQGDTTYGAGSMSIRSVNFGAGYNLGDSKSNAIYLEGPGTNVNSVYVRNCRFTGGGRLFMSNGNGDYEICNCVIDTCSGDYAINIESKAGASDNIRIHDNLFHQTTRAIKIVDAHYITITNNQFFEPISTYNLDDYYGFGLGGVIVMETNYKPENNNIIFSNNIVTGHKTTIRLQGKYTFTNISNNICTNVNKFLDNSQATMIDSIIKYNLVKLNAGGVKYTNTTFDPSVQTD